MVCVGNATLLFINLFSMPDQLPILFRRDVVSFFKVLVEMIEIGKAAFVSDFVDGKRRIF